MFLNAISSHIAVSQSILDALTELHSLVNVEKEKSKQHYKTVQFEQGPVGRPRMVLSLEYISSLLDLNLSIPCIAALLGVSRRTVYFAAPAFLRLLHQYLSEVLIINVSLFMTDPSVFSLQKKSSVIDIYCFRLE